MELGKEPMQLIKLVHHINQHILGIIIHMIIIPNQQLYKYTITQGWTFKIGEIVTITYEEDKAQVVFKKGNNVYRQPVQTNLKPFYAFAGPTNLGDKITIT